MCTNILNIYILRSPQKTVLSFCKKYFLRKKNGESRCGFGQLVPLLKSRGARNSSSKGRNRHFLLILLPVHQHLYKAQKVTFIKFLKTLLYSRSQMQYCECWGKGGGGIPYVQNIQSSIWPLLTLWEKKQSPTLKCLSFDLWGKLFLFVFFCQIRRLWH